MNIKRYALVVDDEPDLCELICLTLERMDIASDSVHDVKQAKQALGKRHYDFCLTDMRLPDGNGIELVEYMQVNYPLIPVAVITAYGNIELAVQALKAGAFDFVSKPVKLDILRNLTDSALKLAQPPRQSTSRRQLLGHSQAIESLRCMVAKLARSQAPVLIQGESGTGKELIARMIHEQSPRAEAPFVPVNCGAIPDDLIESELFGYCKGSFTGATSDKDGLFQAANHGTLFLDEVADLPLHAQVKLLRAIQEKAVRPIGSKEELPVDVRLLSATHQSVANLVQTGEFRQDLFYRINVIELPLPPLRERPEDIQLLTEYFLQQLAQQAGVTQPQLTKDAWQALCQYTFPGNVRELENILERAVALCESNQIDQTDLQLPATVQSTQETQDVPLGSMLDQLEKETIVKALEANHWNRTKTAQQLGLTLRALRYRLKKLDIDGEH